MERRNYLSHERLVNGRWEQWSFVGWRCASRFLHSIISRETWWGGLSPLPTGSSNQFNSSKLSWHDQIYTLREAHHELMQILNESVEATDNFKPFMLLDVLNFSEYTKSAWSRARSQYEEKISPFEDRAAQRIKEIFRKHVLSCLLYCFLRVWISSVFVYSWNHEQNQPNGFEAANHFRKAATNSSIRSRKIEPEPCCKYLREIVCFWYYLAWCCEFSCWSLLLCECNRTGTYSFIEDCSRWPDLEQRMSQSTATSDIFRVSEIPGSSIATCNSKSSSTRVWNSHFSGNWLKTAFWQTAANLKRMILFLKRCFRLINIWSSCKSCLIPIVWVAFHHWSHKDVQTWPPKAFQE